MAKVKNTTPERNLKRRKFPEPGKEPREVFSAALALAKNLLNSKGMRINLDENGNVEFIINGEKLKAIPKEKFKEGLTPEHFTILIGTELESLVKAATYPEPVRGLQNEIPSQIMKQVGTDEFLWRFKKVETELVPQNLRERAIFRRIAQGFILENVTWQVMTKKHDQARGKLSDIPCGSLSIVYASPKSERGSIRIRGEGMSLELPTVREPKQLILELHQSDVEQLIETLKDLRENLDKVKKVE